MCGILEVCELLRLHFMAYHGSAYLWRVVIKSTAFNSTGAVWLGATHYPRLIGRRVAIVAVATR
jgi:hypothetical protein